MPPGGQIFRHLLPGKAFKYGQVPILVFFACYDKWILSSYSPKVQRIHLPNKRIVVSVAIRSPCW